MVNPFLTLAFDVFVIGGTLALVFAALAEARSKRRVVVASDRRFQRQRPRAVTQNATGRPNRVRRRLAA